MTDMSEKAQWMAREYQLAKDTWARRKERFLNTPDEEFFCAAIEAAVSGTWDRVATLTQQKVEACDRLVNLLTNDPKLHELLTQALWKNAELTKTWEACSEAAAVMQRVLALVASDGDYREKILHVETHVGQLHLKDATGRLKRVIDIEYSRALDCAKAIDRATKMLEAEQYAYSRAEFHEHDSPELIDFGRKGKS